ncbi:MAG TPA: hypothetical protein VM925_37075, partial [Labilithrix sp.]|nr:hypothetical protein [Labilithrix sp.]
ATPLGGVMTEVPHSVAVDSRFAYFASNGSIHRVPREDTSGAFAVTTVFQKSGIAIDHLAVDPGESGCVYFWTRSTTSAPAANLVVTSKLSSANAADAGAF